MECTLCKSELDLSKSHILSEFIYEYNQLYDSNHRYQVVSTNPNFKSKKPPKGIYEKLLCKKCEDHFRDLEDKASIQLKNLQDDTKKRASNFQFNTSNYKSFKLFQLSLLWRCSVSNRPEFQDFTLAQHEENIRNMLLNNRPGDTSDYGFYAICTPKNIDSVKQLIIAPEFMGNMFGFDTVRLIYFGFFWIFIIANNAINFPSELRERLFSKSGILTVFVDNKGMDSFLLKIALELRKAGKI
ncbi:hypothetical protein KJ966_20545 [bacterium]|nr:hypothetical protein [bacterium]